jgi:hypothetical protein
MAMMSMETNTGLTFMDIAPILNVAPSQAERGVAAILDWFRGLCFLCE